MTKANIKHLKSTLKHKKAFLITEKRLTGKNTLKGYLHDVDKIIMYIFTPLSTKTIKKIHCMIADHQIEYKGKIDWEQLVIDWECSRLTKPEKQATAYEWLITVEPQAIPDALPIMIKFNIV